MDSLYLVLQKRVTEKVTAAASRTAAIFTPLSKRSLAAALPRFRKWVSWWQKDNGDADFQEAIKEIRWYTEPTEQPLINHYISMFFE